MKEYKVVTETHWYSSHKLSIQVKKAINDLALLGWEVVSVSLSSLGGGSPKAFITLERDSSASNYV